MTNEWTGVHKRRKGKEIVTSPFVAPVVPGTLVEKNKRFSRMRLLLSI